jgi:hypothetical protein
MNKICEQNRLTSPLLEQHKEHTQTRDASLRDVAKSWRQIFRYQQQQFVCDTESEKERVNKNQKDAERNRYADGDKIKQKTKSKKQPPKINLIVTERSSLLPTAAKFSACGVSCCRNASE